MPIPELRLPVKIKLCFFILSLSFFTTHAQWALTQTNGTNYICMVSETTGYVCSWNGMIKKTTDGCAHFTYLVTGTTETLYDIEFPSLTTGYAAGGNGTIIKTTNSGCTWTKLTVPTTATINSMSFVDELTGWAVSANGQIMKTINGGLNWTIQKSTPGLNIRGIHCLNGLVATAVGSNSSVFTTVDGGTSWQTQSTGVTETFFSVKMVSPNVIFMGGNTGGYRSVDAGFTWIKVLSAFNIYGFYGVDFTDPLNGIFASGYGGIFKTTDGGNNWSRMNSNKIYAPVSNYAPNMVNVELVGNAGYISGENGLLFKMHTGDIYDWDYISTGVGYYHKKLLLASDNVAYAGGLGYFSKTIDAGNTWTEASHHPNERLSSIDFYDDNNALAVGYFGRILKTKNAGADWYSQFSGTSKHLYSVTARPSGKAWATGESGTILHTTDGGISWQQQNSGLTLNLYGSSFVSDNVGWVCGLRNVLKTVDGGATWVPVLNNFDETFTAIKFIDANTGWACGVNSTTYGFVYKTIDGGANWTPQLQNMPIFVDPNSIAVTDANNIWIACGLGKIMHSSNGGANWSSQTTNTTSTLMAIKFKDALTGYAAGADGQLLSTIDGGNTWAGRQYHGKSLFHALTVTANGPYWAGEAGYIFFGNGNLSNDDNWIAQEYSIGSTDQLGVFDFTDANNGWHTGSGRDLFRTTNGGKSWKIISNLSLPGSDTLHRAINFKSQQVGYAGTQNGKFAKTTNGGKSWTYYDGTDGLFAVNFYDLNTGMFAGNNGVLVRTTNGCATTTITNHPSGENFNKVQCTNATDVWVSSYSQLFYSPDGGASWQSKLPPGASGVSDFCFINDNTGWVLSNGNLVHSTTDKGNTWTTATIPGPNTYFQIAFNQQSQGMALSGSFLGGGTDVAVLYNPASGINKNFKVDTLDFCKRSLRFTGLDSDPGSQFNWVINSQPYTGQVVSVIFPISPDTVDVKLVVTQGGSACSAVPVKDSSFKIIRFDSIPVAGFTAVASCTGKEVAFTNQSTITDAFSTYKWFFGDGSTDATREPVHAYPQTTNYTAKLVAYSKNGCASDTFSLPVTVKEPAIADAGADFFTRPATPFTLNGCCGNMNYAWEPASLLTGANTATPTAQITTDTYFTLTTTSRDNCTATDQVLAKILIVSEILVPGAFTPNGDTRNDVLYVITFGVTLKRFTVYNRYGEIVFNTTDASKGWDGKYKGKEQNPQTFTWYAEGITQRGQMIDSKGTVILIR